jgi:desulfoferrodoxin-like iron-binding protein
MIDPITQYLLETYDDADNILEGYDLKCQDCGRVIQVIKDGSGPLECCNRRMFVMSSQVEPQDEDPMDEGVRKVLKGQVVKPDFQVPIRNVNFTPDNQAEAEKKQRAEWDKKVKESTFIKDIKEDLETAIEMCGMDHGDDHDHNTQKKSKKKLSKESISVSPEDIKKVRAGATTYSGYKGLKKQEVERQKKEKEHGSIRHYIRTLRGEGYTSRQILDILKEEGKS